MRIIDVVEFLDNTGNEIVHREPQGGPGDFRLGSQVIVRQSQTAVFFREGQALDLLGPGRHTLTTDNLPILAGIVGLFTSGRTPFPAEVVFVNMRQFIDQRWGTAEPVTVRDPVLGMARLRAFGSYAFQVADPQRFVNGVVGQQGKFTTAAVQDYLRSMIIQRFSETIGQLRISALDIAGQLGELSTQARAYLANDFQSLGLALSALYINAVTPTEETSRAIEERSAMGALGNLDEYMKFKAARAMGDAANNPGGAGEGVGLGAGIGLGAGMAGAISQAFQQPAAPPPPPPPPPTAAPAAAGPLTLAQVQATIDSLDMRLAGGEISEATYNRLLARWEAKLKELGGA